MPGNENESFVRWQGRSIRQMGFVNNLLTGLATGLLAFQTQIAFDDKVILSTSERRVAIFSLVLIFASLVVGCYLAWNRLRSFRATAQAARKRETGNREGIFEIRSRYRRLDRITWLCIRWQGILFALGSFLLLGLTIAGYLG
jgi:hypothetical protein